jgi:hypothetical protein
MIRLAYKSAVSMIDILQLNLKNARDCRLCFCRSEK